MMSSCGPTKIWRVRFAPSRRIATLRLIHITLSPTLRLTIVTGKCVARVSCLVSQHKRPSAVDAVRSSCVSTLLNFHPTLITYNVYDSHIN
jgi:hypothetical protein